MTISLLIVPAISATSLAEIACAPSEPISVTESPISVSLKVAAEGPTVGTCNGSTTDIASVPRSRSEGFDYSAPDNSLVFYGSCRPSASDTGKLVAVSYRYWVGGDCPAEGCADTCDPPCVPPFQCEDGVCVCPADCGIGGCEEEHHCDLVTCTCKPDRDG